MTSIEFVNNANSLPEFECNDDFCVAVNADERLLFALDSIAIHFSFKTFLWELTVHLCWPLFNWYSPTIHAHNLFPFNLGAFITVTSTSSVFLIAVATYCLLPNQKADLLVPALFYFMHRVMIAFKYATLSPTEYSKLMTCTDAATATTLRNQIQLLSSWLQFDPLVFEFELYAAAARVGVDIDSLHFLVPQHAEKSAEDLINAERAKPRFVIKDRFTSAEKWDLFLTVTSGKNGIPKCMRDLLEASRRAESYRKTTTIQQKGQVEERRRVSVRELIGPMISYTLKSEGNYKNGLSQLALVSGFVLAVVPLFSYEPLPSEYRVMHMLHLVSTFLITVFFGWANFRFLFTVLVDTNRRLHMSMLLSTLVRPVHHDHTPKITGMGGANINSLVRSELSKVFNNMKSAICFLRPGRVSTEYLEPEPPVVDEIKTFDYEQYIPRVDMEIPQNIYAWLYTRVVLQNLGKRVVFRLMAYTSAMLIVAMSVIVGILLASLHAVRPLQFIQRPVAMQCVILSFFLLAFIVKTIMSGAELNNSYDYHRNLIILNAMRCESELAELLTVVNDDTTSNFVSRANSIGVEVDAVPSESESKLEQEHGVKAFSLGTHSPKKANLDEGTSSKSVRFDDPLGPLIVPDEIGSPGRKGAGINNSERTNDFSQRPYALLTRLKIYELEEAIKAMRRGVEAIAIGRDEYASKVLGIRAATPLILSLFSSAGAFAITLFRVLVNNKRVI